MPSISKTILATATFAALAQAYTQPVGAPTWGALRSPDGNSNVVRGERFTVSWDPTGQTTDGKTVSLVLCKGPGGNCQLQPNAIVEGLPANQRTYEWTVPCSLTPGTASTATGYGMLVIVDGTGEYQYSTQFSIQEGSTCAATGGSTTSGSSSGSTSTTGSATSSSQTTSAASTTTSASTTIPTTQSSVTSSTTVSLPSGVVTTTVTTTTRATSSAATTTSRATSATTTTPNSAAKATGAAGALFAVGVALLAL